MKKKQYQQKYISIHFISTKIYFNQLELGTLNGIRDHIYNI